MHGMLTQRRSEVAAARAEDQSHRAEGLFSTLPVTDAHRDAATAALKGLARALGVRAEVEHEAIGAGLLQIRASGGALSVFRELSRTAVQAVSEPDQLRDPRIRGGSESVVIWKRGPSVTRESFNGLRAALEPVAEALGVELRLGTTGRKGEQREATLSFKGGCCSAVSAYARLVVDGMDLHVPKHGEIDFLI
ncbi:MAG: hypothetical protein IT384_11235 [Deltaproteobacteria bacterium]|nr:hypothetical protein [Deltaproteobacteria bacterium]